ncbi:hypothetical protein FN846DRAFT_937077 [Sphaerosporella brunnea]|uniref:Uncharacterized protein n=1 Tax=Sphaerosporella brunnea TaxID=1250544 RepID=A0A5J5F537_9PEZI|nr:hypothetical protein FN846DRAFT_937077 [Sphaerosporella brunnea]
MASGRSLGLGSRANQAAAKMPPPSFTRQSSTGVAAVKTTTITSTTTTAKRRGFGLFDSEDDYDSEVAETPRQPVRFTGDKSGFVSDSDGSSSIARGTATRKTSSRRSKLTTPSRKIAERRGTPYHKNTSGRLFRHTRGTESENDEERLISDSMFGAQPEPKGAAEKKKARFAVMSDALSEEEQVEEESTEVDTDRERSLSPVKRSPRQRSPREAKQQSQSNVTRQTWGQWLRSIVADPVGTLLHAPVPVPARQPEPASWPEPPRTPTPELSVVPQMPGSFEKPPIAIPPPSPPPANKTLYSGRSFLGHDTQETPIRTGERLFQYAGTPFNFTSPASTASTVSASPASIKKGSRAPTAPTSAKRMAPPPVQSFRKPSNFIARMRGVTKDRYRPYGRPSASPVKATITHLEKIPKNMPPTEILEILEQRERDRKVQEMEDRYIRRETLKKAGLPVEDEEMSETHEESANKGKGKGKVAMNASVEDMDEDEEEQSGTTTPPESPPQKQVGLFKELSPSKPSQPLFQFKPIAPKPPLSPEKKAAPTLNGADKPAFSFSSAASFGSEQEDNDKENMSNPPPPPNMSHRGLPAPPASALALPSSGTSLFADKQPVGGFGISEAPTSPTMSRQRFDKFKPRVSSGLRESATIEKENEQDKENPSDRENNGEEAPAKPGKVSFGTQVTQKPAAAGALREVGRNAPVSTGIKFDVRAKIAAVGHLLPPLSSGIGADVAQLPVRDLSPIVAWPPVEVFAHGDQMIQDAVRQHWNVNELLWLQDWSNTVFRDARQQVAGA